jgi:hypothetical protein
MLNILAGGVQGPIIGLGMCSGHLGLWRHNLYAVSTALDLGAYMAPEVELWR